jgi:cytochrome c biogenesis protein
MSTARRTLDFEKEFARTREAVARALGAKAQAAEDDADAEAHAQADRNANEGGTDRAP